MTASGAPGGEIAARAMHVFFIADHSSSMAGERIEALNSAFREVIPVLQKEAESQPQVEVYVRAIKFATNAEWCDRDPVPLDDYVWADLVADGLTATAQAINLLVDELEYDKMHAQGRNQYPPVCILVSDGFCTDPESDYERAIDSLLASKYGKRAVRLALAIGQPEEYDESALGRFVSHEEVGVLKAEKPADIVKYLRWATVQASKAASVAGSSLDSSNKQNVYLPKPPDDDDDDEFAVF